MMALGTVNSQYLDGSYSMNCAQETYAAADRAVAQIIRQCHKEAQELLIANRDMLDAVAQYLLKKETITGQEMMAILEGKDPEKAEYFGITPGAAPRQDQNGIEPPARSIHIVSEPVSAPSGTAEPEQSASEPGSAGSPSDGGAPQEAGPGQDSAPTAPQE